MRNAIVGVALLLLLGANGGGCNNAVVGVQDYGAVTGRVLDATTNRPIANAIISVGSIYTATADTQGAFTLVRVPIGNQRVTARSPGFSTESAAIEVDKNQTTQVGYLRLVPVAMPVGQSTLPPPATPTPANVEPTPTATPTIGPALSSTPIPSATATPTIGPALRGTAPPSVSPILTPQP